MIRKANHFVTIVSVVLLIGLATSSHISIAGGNEEADQECFAHAIISVEASVVRVEREVLQDIVGESARRSLSAIPVNKIWHCIHEEEAGEVISNSQLLVGNGGGGELNTEESEQRQEKAEEAGEHGQREVQVSFRTEAAIMSPERIIVEFEFKQIAVEEMSRGAEEAEEEHRNESKIEVASRLVMRPGQPRIISAKSNHEVATFLIMTVDI